MGQPTYEILLNSMPCRLVFLICYFTTRSTTQTIGLPRHSPKGSVMRTTHLMNLGVDHWTLVLAAQGTLPPAPLD